MLEVMGLLAGVVVVSMTLHARGEFGGRLLGLGTGPLRVACSCGLLLVLGMVTG